MGLFLGGLFLQPPMHSRISVDPSKEFAKKVVFQAKKSPNTHRGCSGRSIEDRRIIMVYKRKDNYFIVVAEIEDTIEDKKTCRQLISMRLLAGSCILAVGDSLLE